MIGNQNPELDDRLKQIWRDSAERLKKQQAQRVQAKYIDLTKAPIELEALRLIDEVRAKKIEAAAFERKGNQVAIAVFDGKNPEIPTLLEDLKKQGLNGLLFLASRDSLAYAWGFYQFVPKQAKNISSRVDIEPARVLKLEKELISLEKVTEHLISLRRESATPGEFLEVVLAGALTNRASDIHFEPSEKTVGIRYRIDGQLKEFGAELTREQYVFIVSRLKLLSNLRLNISKNAQDGRFTIGLGELQIEIRTSVIPSEFGETIVLRVLDPRIIQLSIPDLGMRPDDLLLVEAQLKAPNGMILNTGPTGSGKTTTLYAFLQKVSTSQNKVITIEDPIEYHLAGIEQTQVNTKAGYSFANGLQSIMRQDPDVILVGEIRDTETVGIAIQAALTGHLVFSTLHTNSATGVIPRLLDLGAPVTSIGPALNLIIAQRLVRRLCTKCKVKQEITSELKTKIENFLTNLPARVARPPSQSLELYAPKKENEKSGCAECHFSGYRGRVGIFELLEVGENLEPLINEKSSEGVLLQFAKKNGLVTLQQDGLLKALAGLTSLGEVEEVTGAISW